MKKRRGHYCCVCQRTLPNEGFTGSGHRDHVCRECEFEVQLTLGRSKSLA